MELLENMNFNDLAQWFERLEGESSRLEMTEMLSDLFKELSVREAQIVSYFCLGELNPPYKNVQFGIARKSALKVVAQLLGIDESDVKSYIKDVADVAALLSNYTWPSSQTLSIEDVYEELERIALISGEGSQEAKQSGLVALLGSVSPTAAKFILRIVLGTLRLGFSDMTLVDAFSWMLVGDKSLSKKIESAYNCCADLGYVASVVKKDGIAGIEKMKVTPGIPIRLAAAERLSSPKAIIEKIGPCSAEPKLDGFRLQIHIDKRKKEPIIHFFSRNLHDMSGMCPDLVNALKDIDADTVIFEGEAIAFDPSTGHFMPFQETVKRKRKHGIDEAMEELPLQLFLFDILYLNGEELFSQTLTKRRKMLTDLIKKSPVDKQIVGVTEEVFVENATKLEDYFLRQISKGLEGVVVKRPDSPYRPGKRNFNWIKLKRLEKGHLLDTIDCIVLGYYYGRGKRAAFGIGALLVGAYNKKRDCFQTVAKIGTGLSDEEWRAIKKRCDSISVKEKPKNVECQKDLYPDVWIQPDIVIEVTADEITRSPNHTAGHGEVSSRTKPVEARPVQTGSVQAGSVQAGSVAVGFALRFPRFLRYRDDKDRYGTTSVKELLDLYEQQRS